MICLRKDQSDTFDTAQSTPCSELALWLAECEHQTLRVIVIVLAVATSGSTLHVWLG